MLNNNQRLPITLRNVYDTSKFTYEWNSEVSQDVSPTDTHIMYNYIINKPTWIMVSLVVTSGGKPSFWPNGHINHTGVCETFLDKI